ncbi:MAG: tetratricopeptide repeat protein [Desulfobulbaceae bacterium]|jgi:Flp pilus assembly protein TadD|nr:tetratricopeptide repeat protein [Desulfobulbaceae bacterium]
MKFPLFLHINTMRLNSGALKSFIPLVFMTLLLPACATTSKPSSHYSPVPSTVMQETAEDKESKLASLPYTELLSRGNQHLAQSNTKLALLHFQMALQKQDDSVEAYAGLGEAMALSGDNQAAHTLLDKTLLLDSQNRQALIATGKLYRGEKNYEQAEISFNQARTIYPADPEILTELAVTYSRMSKDDKVLPLLIQVVEQKPQDASAYNNLGFNYLLQHNYADAIKTLHQALTLAPDNSRIQNNLAAAYALNNQAQKAFNLFRKTGNKATAYNDLGYLYMTMGMEDKARASFEKALELNPRHYVRAKENLSLLENEP